MDKKFLNKFSTTLLYFSILIFIIAFNFAHNPPGGWYQQFLPGNLPNFHMSDMFFLDSLTGWVVTGNGSPNDSSGYILKTSNGGDNWGLQFFDVRDFSRVFFLNSNVGFVSGGYNTGARIYKTTNGGINWFALNIPGGGQIYFNDMCVTNEDTIRVVASNSLVGGVFFTSNGGQSWAQQFSAGSGNPNKIYMFNKDIGFISGNDIWKTTNSGMNWIRIQTNDRFIDINFIDSLTGWKTGLSQNMDSVQIKKTTNGGLNWLNQTLPFIGKNSTSAITDFHNVNRDTIWGVGGRIFYGAGQGRGIVFRTTNGGSNWFYQVPDTSIHIGLYGFIKFANKNVGWAYHGGGGVHTKVGGDSIFYTGIQKVSSEIPLQFELKQNYPNPFNPRTVIPYKIKKACYVRLISYDILGKEVLQLVNQYQQAGEYEVDFIGKYESSGIYFYRIEIEDNNSGKIFSETKHMILLK